MMAPIPQQGVLSERPWRAENVGQTLWIQHLKADFRGPCTVSHLEIELAKTEDAPGTSIPGNAPFHERAASPEREEAWKGRLQLWPVPTFSPPTLVSDTPQKQPSYPARPPAPVISKCRAGAQHWGHSVPLGQFLWPNIPSGNFRLSTHFYAFVVSEVRAITDSKFWHEEECKPKYWGISTK